MGDGIPAFAEQSPPDWHATFILIQCLHGIPSHSRPYGIRGSDQGLIDSPVAAAVGSRLSDCNTPARVNVMAFDNPIAGVMA